MPPLELPVLRGDRVVLRPLEERDVAPLAAILAEPSVARWWGAWDEARVRAALLDEDEEGVLAVEFEGSLAGVLLVGEEADPEYRHASLDISLRTADQGKRLAGEALRLVITHLIEARAHHRFTIDPAADNERAIRAYSRLGFRPVGIMRRYERAPDGSWHDGLLMDLLAEELGGR